MTKKQKPKHARPLKSEAQQLVKQTLAAFRAAQKADLAAFEAKLRRGGVCYAISWGAQRAARAEASLLLLQPIAIRLAAAGNSEGLVLDAVRAEKTNLTALLAGDPNVGRCSSGPWTTGSSNLFDLALAAESAGAIIRLLIALDGIEAVLAQQGTEAP